jgi:hypothetical protein
MRRIRPRGVSALQEKRGRRLGSLRSRRSCIHRPAGPGDDGVALIMVDYPVQTLIGRAYVIRVFDWNCPQHITPRFTDEPFGKSLSGKTRSCAKRLRRAGSSPNQRETNL